MKIIPTACCVGLLLLLNSTSNLLAQGTAFVYQGELSQHGRPARGDHDLRFVLWSAPTNGNQIASLDKSDVAVQGGEFTVTLDFGPGIFDGTDRWLEISVKQRRGDSFIPLSPRQQIMPVPYAITANSASNLLGPLPASQIIGQIPATQLSGSLPPTALIGDYSAPINLHNSSNQFAGDGGQLVNVNAATLNGLTASNFWRLDGNTGTTPGLNFLGTTDERALELKVNNLRALRIEPGSNGAPNVIGGYAGNVVGTLRISDNNNGNYTSTFYPTGVYGAVIGGGGLLNQSNIIASHFGTISGGAANVIERSQSFGFIGGGLSNRLVQADINQYSAIGGGVSNQVCSPGGVISGGMQNRIGNRSSWKTDIGHTIAGGVRNVIGYEHAYSTIGGGSENIADKNHSTIAGGHANSIVWFGNGPANSIGGGSRNYIQAMYPGFDSIVGYGTISGGRSNRVTGAYSSIPGGYRNSAERSFTLAAGHRAKAVHNGAFVWADSSNADFSSTTTNSFSVRAIGGVRFVSAIETSTNGTPTAGVELPAGGGAWATLSDRDSKENFAPVDTREILAQVNQMPILNWNYKSQDQAVRHIGPTAQDFAAAFQVGESAQRITTVDADGVALAAIQGLSQVVAEKDAHIRKLEERLERLEQLLNNLDGERK